MIYFFTDKIQILQRQTPIELNASATWNELIKIMISKRSCWSDTTFFSSVVVFESDATVRQFNRSFCFRLKVNPHLKST